MASLRVTYTSDSSIAAHVSSISTSHPEKRLEFYLDGRSEDTIYIDAADISGIGYDYTYTGLASDTEYELEVYIYYWSQLDGWVYETSASTTGTTTGGGGGGGDDDEWDYELGGSFILSEESGYSDEIYLSRATSVRISVTFGTSGVATFYTTGNLDTCGSLSTSTGFNYSTGRPSREIAYDDDGGDSTNFLIEEEVEAGETYYLWVRCLNSSNRGYTTVNITPPVGREVVEYTFDDMTTARSVTTELTPNRVMLIKASFHNAGTVTFSTSGGNDTVLYFATTQGEWDWDARQPTVFTTERDQSTDESYSTDLQSGYTFYIWIKLWGSTDSGAVTFTCEPPASGGSSLALWDWEAKNGDYADATQTYNAFLAVTNKEPLSNFSYCVWNDMCQKVNEICAELGRSWHIGNYLPYGETLMSDQDKVLTAIRFNSLIHQFDHKGYVSTGIEEQQSGDTVFGSYFLIIAECINDWIEKL